MAKILTDATFKETINSAEGKVLVDFWATWCGPCRMLAPIIEGVEKELEGKVTFCKVDVDECMQTASEYGIMSIPTLIVFENGKPVAQSVGLIPREKVLALLGQ